MGLELKRYDIAVARDGLELDKALEAGEGSGYDTHRITVLHADQLVAEQAGPRYGLAPMSEDNPQKIAWHTLWCHCALTRMRVEVPAFPLFKTRVLDVSAVADTTDTTPDANPQAEGSVDPTPLMDPRADTGSP